MPACHDFDINESGTHTLALRDGLAAYILPLKWLI